jgi:hypothetical protein
MEHCHNRSAQKLPDVLRGNVNYIKVCYPRHSFEKASVYNRRTIVEREVEPIYYTRESYNRDSSVFISKSDSSTLEGLDS